MGMGDEKNGHGTSRLDRIEQAIESLADDFREEHKRLLTAQILLVDRMSELTGRIDKLANSRGPGGGSEGLGGTSEYAHSYSG